MKSILVLSKPALLLLIFIAPATPPVPTGSSTLGVFVATSPCNAVSRSLLQIPATADCEMIKWNLTLYQDANTLTPTTYKLNFVYGLPEQGTKGLSKGGTKVEREGEWTIGRGTRANPHAVVYQLDPGRPQGPVSFLQVDHNLLHLLDRDKNLAIGTAGWSYTLNRNGNFGRNVQPANPPASSALQPTSPTTPASPITTDSSILGPFLGRSPCHDVARELNKPVSADCIKVKWDLTLYQDRTLTPTTYKLGGTFYRERIREGKWTIVRGTRANPDAVVYQLDPGKPKQSLFFLKADDNILFFLDKERTLMRGNGDFSYTLNKADKVLKN